MKVQIMKTISPSRRFFLKKTAFILPAISLLSSCGGGGSGSSSSILPTTPSPSGGSVTSPTTTTPPPTTNTATDLSYGLRDFGQSPIPYSLLAKPAKGQTVIDPDTGMKITRITDCVNDFKNLCAAPAYPTAMAWNCDESYFILYLPGSTAQSGGTQGWALYDGKTYQFINMLNINPADVEQFYWDHQNPAIVRYIDNHSVGSTVLADLTEINVQTGNKTVTYSFLPNGLPPGFPTAGPIRCGYPFALGINSQGERIWGLGAGGVPNVDGELGLQVFGFNESTKQFTLYDSTIIPQPQARGSTPFPSLSGKYFIWNAAASTGLNSTPTTQSGIFDAITGQFIRWVNFDTNEHCDTAQNSLGQDLLVGSQFSRNTGGNGNVIVCNIETGEVFNFVGESSGWGYPVTGSLSGATAWKNPNWVVTGMTGDIYGTNNNGPTPNPTTVLDQEIALTNLDTGKTWRLAHHRSTGNWSNASQSNYWAQTNVTFSTTGTRILFQSDWGCLDPSNPTVNPNAPVDTYLLTLPSYTG